MGRSPGLPQAKRSQQPSGHDNFQIFHDGDEAQEVTVAFVSSTGAARALGAGTRAQNRLPAPGCSVAQI